MRTLFFITFLTSLIVFNNKLLSQTKANKTANEVLETLSNKLDLLTIISYDYYRSINYFSENYYHEYSARTFLDFKSDANVIGLKYQFEDKQYKMIYNGVESFYLNKKNKTMKITNKQNLLIFLHYHFL
jgi:hypothetical protein